MLFALICTDKPDALQTRLETRAAHLAYIEKTGVVAQAGPLIAPGGGMCGSLIILEVDNRDEASAWAAADPYALAGLFADVRIEAWKRVIGE